MNTQAKVVGGFLVGAILGTATGLLIAPRSGKKTRRKIANGSRQMMNDLMDQAKDSIATAKGKYNQSLESYAKSGKDSIDSISGALHAR